LMQTRNGTKKRRLFFQKKIKGKLAKVHPIKNRRQFLQRSTGLFGSKPPAPTKPLPPTPPKAAAAAATPKPDPKAAAATPKPDPKAAAAATPKAGAPQSWANKASSALNTAKDKATGALNAAKDLANKAQPVLSNALNTAKDLATKAAPMVGKVALGSAMGAVKFGVPGAVIGGALHSNVAQDAAEKYLPKGIGSMVSSGLNVVKGVVAKKKKKMQKRKQNKI